MDVLAAKRLPSDAAKRRRTEIEQTLAEYGLGCGRFRRSSHPGPAVDRFRRLSAALASLGPVFSYFGLYLSSRPDLLLVKDCHELAAIPDRSDPAPILQILQLIEDELGRPLERAYARFDPEPFESRLLFQSHRGFLLAGEAVTIRIVRPGLEDLLARDVALLGLLESALGLDHKFPIKEALDDFRRVLKQKINLLSEAQALAELARDSNILRGPIPYPELSTSKVLTVERLPGKTLEDLISPFNDLRLEEGESAGSPSPGSRTEGRDLANRLCLAWLTQALQGRHFPAEPRPADVLILSSDHIVFTGGTFCTLQQEAKRTLFDYMTAAYRHEPERTCSCLLSEMHKTSTAIPEDQLQQKLRQLVPFRDGGSAASGDTLAEHLFLHWRLATQSGYVAGPHLVCFFRGLFSITDAASRLAPGHDTLSESLEELRMGVTLEQFRQMFSFSEMILSADQYATMMMELPKRFDQALTVMGQGSLRFRIEGTDAARYGSSKKRLAVVWASLMVLVSVALLSRWIDGSAAGVRWTDKAAVVAFILVSAVLLRAVGRVR